MALTLMHNLVDKEKNKDALIIAAGASTLSYNLSIASFINKKKPFTIGINKMTHLFIPDYHLWTNTQRLFDQGYCIVEGMSTILIGSHIPPSVIGKWIKNYVSITYLDREGESLTIDRN